MAHLRRMFVCIWCLAASVVSVLAQDRGSDRLVRLHASDALVEAGLLRHILPRFTLKTQIRVEVVSDPAESDVLLGLSGRPLFEGLGVVWHLDQPRSGHGGTNKLVDWLLSDVGRNTVQSFAPEGTALFGPPPESGPVADVVEVEGDAQLGHVVSRAKCTRCHAVDEETIWNSNGATPSFAVLRSLPDWQDRFAVFYVLKPHPSFMQIPDVTEPFPKERPPPLVPIEITLDELDAVLAYVATLTAADLGQPLVHQ